MTDTTPRPSNAPAEATHRMDYARDSNGEPTGTVWPVRIVTPGTDNTPARIRYWEAGRETADPYEMRVPEFARLTPYGLPVTRTAPTPPEATHYMTLTDATAIDDNAYPCRPAPEDGATSGRVLLWNQNGTRVLDEAYDLYPGVWSLTPITPGDATSAPQEPADAITRWSDAMTPAERVAALATFWQTCDEEADEQGACEQYERSYAWRNGHPGRDDKQTREWEAEVTVTTTTTRTRTFSLTIEATDEEEAERDVYEVWGDHYPDSDDEEEDSEEVEVSVSAYDDGFEISEPTPLDDVVRAAIQHANTRNEYHAIPTAGLRALIDQHACPVTQSESVEVSGRFAITGTQPGAYEAVQAAHNAVTLPGNSSVTPAVIVAWRGNVAPQRTEDDYAAWNGHAAGSAAANRAWRDHLALLARRVISAAYPERDSVASVGDLDYTTTSVFQVNA